MPFLLGFVNSQLRLGCLDNIENDSPFALLDIFVVLVLVYNHNTHQTRSNVLHRVHSYMVSSVKPIGFAPGRGPLLAASRTTSEAA